MVNPVTNCELPHNIKACHNNQFNQNTPQQEIQTLHQNPQRQTKSIPKLPVPRRCVTPSLPPTTLPAAAVLFSPSPVHSERRWVLSGGFGEMECLTSIALVRIALSEPCKGEFAILTNNRRRSQTPHFATAPGWHPPPLTSLPIKKTGRHHAPCFILLITFSLVNSSLSFSSKALEISFVRASNLGIVIFFSAFALF